MFAAEKMEGIFSASRQRMSGLLMDSIKSHSDVVSECVGPGEKSLAWLCDTEDRIWRAQISRAKSSAALWITVVAFSTPLIAYLYNGNASTAGGIFLTLCLVSIVSSLAFAISAARLLVLFLRGYSDRSEHMFKYLGGKFWVSGSRGLYLAETTEIDDRFFETTAHYAYEKLGPPILTVGPDIIAISLYADGERFITNMVFSAEEEPEATKFFTGLESRIKSSRLSAVMP